MFNHQTKTLRSRWHPSRWILAALVLVLVLFLITVSFNGLASLHSQASAPADLANPARRSSFRLPSMVLGDVPVAELSGLAWDADDRVLYAIADDGYLYRFRVHLESRRLKSVEPVEALRLRWPSHLQPQPKGMDVEGLAILKGDNGVPGDAELLISTEGQPQVLRVSTHGQVLSLLDLPEPLSDASRYQAKSTMLEALAHSPQHGLLAAAEVPLNGQPAGFHQIHAKGRSWRFPVLDADRFRLKAMELLPDGTLVVLERARVGKEKRLINALRSISLASCGGDVTCDVKELLLMDHTEGAENFEGMTYLGDGQYLLVSDNKSKGTPSVFMLIDIKTTDRE